MRERRTDPPAVASRTGAGWLSHDAHARLRGRVESARRRATPGRAVLASVTERLADAHDPSAIVLGSCAAGEHWSCLEQPERGGASLATLGSVLALEQSGPGRFGALDRAWRDAAGRAIADAIDGPAGSGLVAVCGFAFAPAGGAGPAWRGFPSASLVVPEVALARTDAGTWLTVNVLVGVEDSTDALLSATTRRLETLREVPLPLLDPAPTGKFTVHGPMPPSHYEEAVNRAVEKILDGQLEKVVLAREVQVDAPTDHDPAAVLGVLRSGFPSCFVYAVGRGEAAFIGASPELLVRREGQRASTVALAGSTRRSADPAVDDHLGEALLRSEKDRHENLIVARRIVRALKPHAIWVTVAPEPVVIRVANIQHLAAPIRAQLAQPMTALELAGALHPTPAVGGEPNAIAQELIPALEGFDRGWYAGTVGWTDGSGDGEFCVTLRCALLRGRLASCFAGCGIVADSDPAAELAETEVKLQALLPVLSG